MTEQTYTVTVTREDDLWVAIVEGLPPHVVGALDFETLDDMRETMPHAIADLLDADPDDVVVVWRFVGQPVPAEFAAVDEREGR